MRLRIRTILGIIFVVALAMTAWQFAHKVRINVVNRSKHRITGIVAVMDPRTKVLETPHWVEPGESFQLTFGSVNRNFRYHGLFVTNNGLYLSNNGITFSGLPMSFQFVITLKEEMLREDTGRNVYKGLNPDNAGTLHRSKPQQSYANHSEGSKGMVTE